MDPEERIRNLEINLASLKARLESTTTWFKAAIVAFVAIFGVSSFILVPARVGQWLKDEGIDQARSTVQAAAVEATKFTKRAEELDKKLDDPTVYRWTPLAPINLGSLPVREPGDADYDIPRSVPQGAHEVLVFLWISSGITTPMMRRG